MARKKSSTAILSCETCDIGLDLYALACLKLIGPGRQFTVSVPEGANPSAIAEAFERLGCTTIDD